MLVFEERGKPEYPGEKPLGARERTNNKLNPHMASTPYLAKTEKLPFSEKRFCFSACVLSAENVVRKFPTPDPTVNKLPYKRYIY